MNIEIVIRNGWKKKMNSDTKEKTDIRNVCGAHKQKSQW